MTTQTRYYGVSSGNGNDGVSHIFPDYIVKTDDPWLVARLAQVTTFKPGRGRKWCRANLVVDGESDYTIYATILDPPGRDGAGWSDHNGAWSIIEVYPWDAEYKEPSETGKPVYEDIESCFGKRECAIERKLLD